MVGNPWGVRGARVQSSKYIGGREAKLNRVIFLILDSKNLLTSYEMHLEIRRIKGFRHVKR